MKLKKKKVFLAFYLTFKFLKKKRKLKYYYIKLINRKLFFRNFLTFQNIKQYSY